jgi:hypothetical protein
MIVAASLFKICACILDMGGCIFFVFLVERGNTTVIEEDANSISPWILKFASN